MVGILVFSRSSSWQNVNPTNYKLEFLAGMMCGFLRGGGGDDKDGRFEFSGTLVWAYGA